MAELTMDQIDGVLRHLPFLKRPDLVLSSSIPSKRQGNILVIGGEKHSPEITQLIQDLYENGFVIDFDWPAWQKSAETYYKEPEQLKYATLDTLQKLLTISVRKDHFCEGHFSAMVRSGHVTAIIERLAEIQHGVRATLPDNPWLDLPNRPPFVLPQDKALIDQFNSKAAERYHIPLDILPEPYLGNPDAPVVLLGLNPGFNVKDPEWHGNARFRKLSRANLLHKRADYPFYLLDPTIDRTKWWDRNLRWLIEEVGCAKTVANNVLCVELFPYHSKRFKHAKLCLKSQQYSFALVRQAIERNAVILLLRGYRLWLSNIPELQKYPSIYIARSFQTAAISPGNFPNGFKAAVDVLRKLGKQDAN